MRYGSADDEALKEGARWPPEVVLLVVLLLSGRGLARP
jgi:hypothetical protein